ncbi:hypothetical protein [Pseudorhodoplanes sinuspersici]|uniref:Uncharacterized protein n=1 Tax=Pseudorhodoplanes sinuspersici TaxID=1235591 RepID=A0A1W6ZKM4_9HYPH|nr:hypothetical protein [Pseudorhodoplanes sinuspersici]ARP97891.1 hypothetical protein CAK95_01440 [Pseudorhodoplanes sinuspersici]RKE68371.1 hypothetical protein DFP91_4755 [Pseudorhodoplanes sinuspersici]
MKELSFRDFILSHSPEDSAAGDFVRDTKAMKEIPDVTSWEQLLAYLEQYGAYQPAIDAAKVVWARYDVARKPIPVELGVGLTVARLTELLAKENPDAHVITYNPRAPGRTGRVLGFARVTIENGGPHRLTPALMLEG